MSLEEVRELRDRAKDDPRRKLALVAKAVDELKAAKQRAEFAAPGGFVKFMAHFWHCVEPGREMTTGWALEALCTHLEAVADGRIKRLLLNVCPGAAKSLTVSCFFPLYVWCCKEPHRDKTRVTTGPSARFLSLSYNSMLPERDNRRSLQILNSDAFKRLYGHLFKLEKAGEMLISNNKTGFKQALGVGSALTGSRGDYLLYDDPNSIVDVESDVIRENTARIFLEAASNRLNDMASSAVIVVQQRSHQGDVSGVILDGGYPYEHLCIPMLYEEYRKCRTSIGWEDPRTVEGECFWPERYPPDAVQVAMDQGEFAWAGQWQQRPSPRGGGILKEDYWRNWNPEPDPNTGKRTFPECDFILASLDPAFSSKEQNDPSALTIWGCFQNEDGGRAVILLDAFSKKLELMGVPQERWKGETDFDYRARTEKEWGLVETVYDRCRRFDVDVLLVENKGSGLSVVQTMEKLFLGRKFQIKTADPKGLDKMARAIRVQPVFSAGQIWAPQDKSWAQMVIQECGIFPRGIHDDCVDSTTQAIYWLRTHGFLPHKDEQFMSKREAMQKYKELPPIYNI